VITLTGAVTELHLIVVAFALNTTYAIAKPSIISILPGLVPKDEITDAVGLNTTQFILGQVAGPTIAALVMATAGAGWAFSINALTYLGPILSMIYLQRRGLGERTPSLAGKAGPVGSTTSAMTFIREQRWVLALLAGVFTTSAPLEVIRTLSPALVVEGLHQSETAAGLIVAAQSVGSALALIVFVPLRKRGWSRRMDSVGLVAQAVGLAGAAVANGLPAACVAVGLTGLGFSLCFPVLTGTLQSTVPDHVRGRVMAFHQMSHLGNRPFTALAVGSLATLVGAQHAILAGLVLAPIGLFASRRAWRRLDELQTGEASALGSAMPAVELAADPTIVDRTA
jgi:transmembrane secretion effector